MNSQQHCSPAEARQVFKFRPWKNFALGLGAFIPLFFLLLLFLNVWVSAGIASVPALCLYFFLEWRVIFIKCPNCGQDVDTNTPWLCGYKGCRNENVDHQHPFIHECEHCRFIPKAYECHHCGQPIFLTSDRQKLHLAKSLGAPAPVLAPTELNKDKTTVQLEQVKDLEHELKVASLKKQIETVANQPLAPGIKSPEQAFEEEILASVDQDMTRAAVAKRLKDQANVEFANDEHMRQQKHALIDDAMRKRLE